MPTKPALRTPTLPTLADQLARASAGARHTLGVPLTAAATGVALLGAPPVLRQALFTRFAEEPSSSTLPELTELWTRMQKSSTYLIGYLDPLLDWIADTTPGSPDAHAFTRCAKVLAGVDLAAVASSSAARGDILGPLYTFLRSPGTRAHLGAFYTPPDVAATLAALAGLHEGVRVLEPACGAGGMVVAHVRAMRAAGLDPDTCQYVLNDIDALAVALAGINLSALGMTKVELHVGDMLALGAGPGEQAAAVQP